jgi:glutamyl-tRNA reductase
MLISLAVDFQAADVATRERFHLSPKRVAELYANFQNDGLAELALIATCNRTELYAWCPDATPESVGNWAALMARRWMPEEDDTAALLGVAAVRTNLAAARHTLRVASGLESQILGDGQILGQTRRAHASASAANAAGPVLHRLFETALRAGKRVRTSTGLCSGTTSIGAQAVAFAAKRYGPFANARIVIAGCGKTGECAARQFVKLGARNLVLLNRSASRSEQLASDLAVRSAPMQALHAEIANADIVVVATGSEEPLVTAAALESARRDARTNEAPLLLIDLSMPRNIEVATAALPGVSLADLDMLHPVVADAERVRRSAIPAAEAVVEAELQDFADWLATASARAAIRPLREALADVCRRELAHVTSEEVAQRISKRIVAKMMASPMLAVRNTLARGEPVAELTRSIHVLFSQPEFSAADE